MDKLKKIKYVLDEHIKKSDMCYKYEYLNYSYLLDSYINGNFNYDLKLKQSYIKVICANISNHLNDFKYDQHKYILPPHINKFNYELKIAQLLSQLLNLLYIELEINFN